MYFKGDQSKLFITKDRTLNSTPILFIHGFTGSSRSWKDIREKIDYPSLAVDIPGHGKSTFNHLNEDGLYIIEDLQTSYIPRYGGSRLNLNKKKTSMNFIKNLVKKLFLITGSFFFIS